MPQTTFKTIDSMDMSGKRVLVRVDLNVPMKNGVRVPSPLCWSISTRSPRKS